MGFNGLQGAVAEKLEANVPDGTMFVFTKRRRTQPKVLYFAGTDLWLLTKRLKRANLSWPRQADGQATRIRLAPENFAMLTDVVDSSPAKSRAARSKQGTSFWAIPCLENPPKSDFCVPPFVTF